MSVRPFAVVRATSLSVAALLPLVVCVITFAQRETVEPVKFPPGRTTAVLRGKVSGRSSHTYLLKARKGQQLTAHLSGQSGPVFSIRRPDQVMLSELDVRDWEGELPATGTYRITVEVDTEGLPSRGYVLEVNIR